MAQAAGNISHYLQPSYRDYEQEKKKDQQQKPQYQQAAFLEIGQPQFALKPIRHRNIQIKRIEDFQFNDRFLLPKIVKIFFDYLPLNEQQRLFCVFQKPPTTMLEIQKQLNELKAQNNDDELVVLKKLIHGLITPNEAVKLFSSSLAIILQAVMIDWSALENADKDIFVDKQIALRLVRIDGRTLRFLDSFKNDPDVCLEAITQNHEALVHAENSSNISREKAIEIVRKNGHLLQHLNQFQSDPDIRLIALMQGYIVYCPEYSIYRKKDVVSLMEERPDLYILLVVNDLFPYDPDVAFKAIAHDFKNIYLTPKFIALTFVFYAMSHAMLDDSKAMVSLAFCIARNNGSLRLSENSIVFHESECLYNSKNNPNYIGYLAIKGNLKPLWRAIFSSSKDQSKNREEKKFAKLAFDYFLYKAYQSYDKATDQQADFIKNIESGSITSKDQKTFNFNFSCPPEDPSSNEANLSATRLLELAALKDKSGLAVLELARIKVDRCKNKEEKDEIIGYFNRAFEMGQIIAYEKLGDFLLEQLDPFFDSDDEDADLSHEYNVEDIIPIFTSYYKAAIKFEESGKTEDARRCLMKWVTHNETYVHVESQIRLGRYHLNGIGGPINLKAAFDCFHTAVFKACEKNTPAELSLKPNSINEGILDLASCYEFGTGVLQDTKKAANLYRIASEADGKVFDDAQKRFFFMYAVALGDQIANGKYYYDEAIYFEKTNQLEKARKNFELASTYQHIDSILKMGKYCYNGIGGEQNAGKAVEYFEHTVYVDPKEIVKKYRSLNEGFILLAACYEMGKGVEKDTEKAIKLYREGSKSSEKIVKRLREHCQNKVRALSAQLSD